MHRKRTRGRRTLLSAAVACVAALAVVSTAAADFFNPDSPPIEGEKRPYSLIIAKHSGLNVNVPEASTSNGTQVIQWDGGAFMNGQWEQLSSPKHAGVAFRNRWSRQCLTVDSKTDGAPVVQRPCDGSIRQQWWYRYDKQSPLHHNLVNVWSGLDLNVVGASYAPGAKLMQFHHVPGASNALFILGFTKFVVD
jgi:ricin-type beta-trefoil lectin protein